MFMELLLAFQTTDFGFKGTVTVTINDSLR